MKRLGLVVGLVIFLASEPANARGRCRAVRPRRGHVVMQPVAASDVAIGHRPATVAPGQAWPSSPLPQAQQVASTLTDSRAALGGEVRPLYNYAATNQARPAYYYAYDDSGKMVVRQWVDYLFRGGKAEGMPRPPLPLIGRIGSRD